MTLPPEMWHKYASKAKLFYVCFRRTTQHWEHHERPFGTTLYSQYKAPILRPTGHTMARLCLHKPVCWKSGRLWNMMRYPSETHFKFKSRSSRTSISVIQSFRILHRARQYYCRHILCAKFWNDSMTEKLWANEISQDLGWRWVSDGYLILHNPQVIQRWSNTMTHAIYILAV